MGDNLREKYVTQNEVSNSLTVQMHYGSCETEVHSVKGEASPNIHVDWVN